MLKEKEAWVSLTQPLNLAGIYEVSSYGRLKRLGRYAKIKGHWIAEKIIIGSKNDKGYVKIKIAGRKQFSVHRLVALHFIPNPENLPEVNHKDFDKTNNNVSNLEWSTGQGNMDHYYASDRVVRRKIKAFKISNEDVKYIRKNILTEGCEKLAKKFNTHPNYIYSIATGRVRRDVDFPPLHKKLGLTKIILDVKTGIFYESPQELAELLGVNKKNIHRRLNGERPNNTPYRYV